MGGFQTFLTRAFVVGIIIFIIFLIWGAGGGFKVIYDVGKLAKSIPTWAWLGLAVIILFKMLFGKK